MKLHTSCTDGCQWNCTAFSNQLTSLQLKSLSMSIPMSVSPSIFPAPIPCPFQSQFQSLSKHCWDCRLALRIRRVAHVAAATSWQASMGRVLIMRDINWSSGSFSVGWLLDAVDLDVDKDVTKRIELSILSDRTQANVEVKVEVDAKEMRVEIATLSLFYWHPNAESQTQAQIQIHTDFYTSIRYFYASLAFTSITFKFLPLNMQINVGWRQQIQNSFCIMWVCECVRISISALARTHTHTVA